MVLSGGHKNSFLLQILRMTLRLCPYLIFLMMMATYWLTDDWRRNAAFFCLYYGQRWANRGIFLFYFLREPPQKNRQARETSRSRFLSHSLYVSQDGVVCPPPLPHTLPILRKLWGSKKNRCCSVMEPGSALEGTIQS